jgi:HSP20 family protein
MMTFYMTPRHRARMQRYYTGDRVARNIGISSEVHVPVDVKDEQDAYVIVATLPGLEAEDLNIEILDKVVDNTGEFKDTTDDASDNFLRRERPVGSFHRRLRFATQLVAADAEATLKNGILNLRLPKVEEERPKAIKVKTK